MTSHRQEPHIQRRQLLRSAGAIAAGGAAAAVASSLTTAAPAEAADGQNMLLGKYNTASSQTTLTGGAGFTQSAYLFVHDPADPVGSPLYDTSAIAASAVGAKHGVQGVTYNTAKGAGVYGIGVFGATVGVRAIGPAANLQLDPTGVPPPARTDAHVVGQIIEDNNADLWLCVVAGTPGTFRKLAGPNTAGAFHVLNAPVRVYDSRAGYPPAAATKGPLGNGSYRQLDAKANGSGVPVGATAIQVNLTVTQTSSQGFLALFKNGISWPGTSSINWDHAGQTVANMAVVALDASALFRAYANVGCTCDFLVDVVGYWR